jgi:hypothetical protein
MPTGLEISLAPEKLDEGSPEERAAFGLFSVCAGALTLTEGFDSFVAALRAGPLVSGYHAAEWFAWNWWRLLHEPYSPRSADWWRAHKMTAIGEGYVWPNITFRTDGVRAAILSEPSTNPEAKTFRYLGAPPWVGPTSLLEDAIRAFITRVAHRLDERGVHESNFQRILADLDTERLDTEMMERRRLEALLGYDPGEVDDNVIQTLLSDAAQFGAAAIDELAADAAGGVPLNADRLRTIATYEGIEARPGDAAKLSPNDLADAREQPAAWQQGRHAAKALRLKERLGASPVSTARLRQLLGTSGARHGSTGGKSPLSFLLDEGAGHTRVILRSRWDTGRRFEMARLLGDHLLFGADATLLPATRAYTFRQKAQRSFAAEFLSPFGVIEDMLQGDFSPEAIEEVAEHFDVSTMTIETLLRNHGLIEREPMADAA